MSQWWAKYIGTPYAEAHCWELVRRVYAAERDIDLPTYGEIDAAKLVEVARVMAGAIEDARVAETWVPVTHGEAFDVALLRGRAQVWHVGVMVGPRHMLHTERATNAVVVPISCPLIAGRVTGYRRYIG